MAKCRNLACDRDAALCSYCSHCEGFRPLCPVCGGVFGEHSHGCIVTEGYHDCLEGPWETAGAAHRFAKAEVGLPFEIVYGAGAWYIMVCEEPMKCSRRESSLFTEDRSMKHYFYHAEISKQCIETHGIVGALHEAAKRGENVYRDLLLWLDANPDGRIVLSIGRDDKKPARIDSPPADFEARLLASYPRSTRFADSHLCPRGAETGRPGNAVWQSDDTCSWCGSLHPALFMERLEAGDVILEPTDKDYKVYVRPKDGANGFSQTYRGEGDPGGADPSQWVWTTRPTSHAKFYFQHLPPDARTRFADLLNQRKLTLDVPGRFYRLPFFLEVKEPYTPHG